MACLGTCAMDQIPSYMTFVLFEPSPEQQGKWYITTLRIRTYQAYFARLLHSRM